MEELDTQARFEGLARFMLYLTAELDDRGLIDGLAFEGRLRDEAPSGTPMLDLAAELMHGLAATLADARASRRGAAL